MFALTAKTEPGAHLVRLAEALAIDLAGRAGEHDREATYPHESIAALQRAGYFTAPIPVEHGGLGVLSVHDLVVASSRLARGDASVAIGVNMHLAVLISVVRRWFAARNAGDTRREAAFGAWMESVVADGTVIATAISELGQDLTRPQTLATRTPDGWRIDGRKAFCTMAPAATVISTAVTFTDEQGGERYGYAQIPATAPGVRIEDDWDAVGMRASGSHSITFAGVELPGAALRGGFRVGDTAAYLERNLPAGLFHASASLGIAEAAATAVKPRDDARTRALLVENAVELSACRAALSRAGGLIDDHYADGQTDLTAVFAEVQAAKAFLTDASARVVDRALSLSGGAGYLNGHPLARAYRDVRAGGFMHPLGGSRLYEFLGEVALGRTPALH